jgi:hypothetical protein
MISTSRSMMNGPFGNGLDGNPDGIQGLRGGAFSNDSLGGPVSGGGAWFGGGSTINSAYTGLSGTGSGLYNSGASNLASDRGLLMNAAMNGGRDSVNQAATDAKIQSENAIGSAKRGLSRMGVNPNSGRFAGLMKQERLAGAALETGAMTRAERAATEDQFSQLMSIAGLDASMMREGASLMQSGASIDASQQARAAAQAGENAQSQAELSAYQQAMGGGQNEQNSPSLYDTNVAKMRGLTAQQNTDYAKVNASPEKTPSGVPLGLIAAQIAPALIGQFQQFFPDLISGN